MTLRFGTIPTNGRDCVDRAVSSLLPQVDYLAVIEAGPTVIKRTYPEQVSIFTDEIEPLNISRWWNLGLEWAQTVAMSLEENVWDIAIINDDVEVPPTWLCYIADDMRQLGCVGACSGGNGSSAVIHRAPATVSAFTRLQGFAFVLAGESGIRANEEYRWYFSDDHIDFTARTLGGSVMFPGCHVTHRHPNSQMTPDMQVIIAEDAAKFHAQWGVMPT